MMHDADNARPQDQADDRHHEQSGGRIGKSASKHDPHGPRDVTLELTFGNTRRLKILPIEVGRRGVP